MNSDAVDGIGMTSRRTRLRLVERLRAEGIHDEAVLEAKRLELETALNAVTDRAYELVDRRRD